MIVPMARSLSFGSLWGFGCRWRSECGSLFIGAAIRLITGTLPDLEVIKPANRTSQTIGY